MKISASMVIVFNLFLIFGRSYRVCSCNVCSYKKKFIMKPTDNLNSLFIQWQIWNAAQYGRKTFR